MLEKLSAQNRFALAFRTHNMKTEAGRKKKIATFVAMLKRGETIYPQNIAAGTCTLCSAADNPPMSAGPRRSRTLLDHMGEPPCR